MSKTKGRADGLKEIKIEVSRGLDGKAIRKSFYGHTKKEAQDKAKEYMQKRQYREVDEKITLADWIDKWLPIYKSNVRKISYISYVYFIENHIKPYFKDARLSAIRPIDIQEFLKSKNHYSLALIRGTMTILKNIFNAAIENNLIYKNPVGKIKIESKATPIEKRAYTEYETKDIIKYAKTHKFGLSIILMLKLGLRRSEVLALRWRDIDFKNKTVTINQSASWAKGGVDINKPKTKSSNDTLPIDDDLILILQSSPRTIGKYDYIIHKKNGDVMFPDNFIKCHYNVFMEDYKKYYMEHNEGKEPRILTPHELRHTFGSLIYEATRDIYITSKMMRHSNTKITQETYVHESFDIKREALGKVIAFKNN